MWNIKIKKNLLWKSSLAPLGTWHEKLLKSLIVQETIAVKYYNELQQDLRLLSVKQCLVRQPGYTDCPPRLRCSYIT